MTLGSLGIAAYILTVLVALTLTHHEQRQRGRRAAPARVLAGYALCTVWPLMAAVLVILYRPAMALGRTE